MLFVSVVIFCLVGAGLIGMGYKYITAVPPLDYHADILSGTTVTDEVKMILGALYKVMGGAFTALGAGMILIALTGVWNDLFLAKVTVMAMSGIAGWFAITAAKHVEDQTKTKTPWRIAAGLSGLSVLGFVLSLL